MCFLRSISFRRLKNIGLYFFSLPGNVLAAAQIKKGFCSFLFLASKISKNFQSIFDDWLNRKLVEQNIEQTNLISDDDNRDVKFNQMQSINLDIF